MKKRKPSKQAGNRAKRESNIGDYKGTFIQIDPVYLQYLKNLYSNREERKEKEFSLFLRLYLKLCPDKSLRTKDIQNIITDEFKKTGYKLSRAKFFRLQKKVMQPLAEESEILRQQLIADKKRKITKEQFEEAIKSPSCKKITLQEDALIAKEWVEEHFKKLGEKIKRGTSSGSFKGAKSTKQKYI